MFAASSSLDLARVLLDLAIILVVAKLAAELAERVGIPAVVGEIVAGILIGPSVISLVTNSDSLFVLAEIGVILLLLQVGMEMDLGELRKVGRMSVTVAIIGASIPMGLGYLAGLGLGESSNTALFIGATLTATSVGITARVFADLRALSTTEARIVLGAAVADDVLGLVILAVVTRLVEQGSVDATTVARTMGGALLFLVVAGALAVVVVPRILNFVARESRSAGTVSTIAIGATFFFATVAMESKLAPIIGAFVAGLALSRTTNHDRISRDIGSVASVFVPVFFVSIGINTDVGAMAKWHVIGLALLLSIIAVFGKMIASIGTLGVKVDRLLIGIGMVPRGEVGLIFATIGLSVGVFDDELYAVVLLVVLITTLITPPLLRWRLGSAPRQEEGIDPIPVVVPDAGWLSVADDEIKLNATPPNSQFLTVGLDCALLAVQARPGSELLDWVARHRNLPLAFDARCAAQLLTILREGNERSWRFLEISAILDRALPEVARAMRRRHSNLSELDPTHSFEFPCVESLRSKTLIASTDSDALMFAAFLTDLESGSADTLTVINHLNLDIYIANEIKDLLNGSRLLRAAVAREPIRTDHKTLSEIAQYLRNANTVERARLLASASGLQVWQDAALLDVTTAVKQILAHPELLEDSDSSVAAMRLREVLEFADTPEIAERLMHAPASYLLSRDTETLLRQARLVEPAPAPGTVRVNVQHGSQPDTWMIDVACKDRKGLLARITSVLANENLSVLAADVATWPDGAVVDTFLVSSPVRPSKDHLAHLFGLAIRRRFQIPRRVQGPIAIEFDNDAHPWHTVVNIRATDQVGLLNAVAFAFAKANIQIHHALVQTTDNTAIDRFEVSDRTGRKLPAKTIARAERWIRLSEQKTNS